MLTTSFDSYGNLTSLPNTRAFPGSFLSKDDAAVYFKTLTSSQLVHSTSIYNTINCIAPTKSFHRNIQYYQQYRYVQYCIILPTAQTLRQAIRRTPTEEQRSSSYQVSISLYLGHQSGQSITFKWPAQEGLCVRIGQSLREIWQKKNLSAFLTFRFKSGT